MIISKDFPGILYAGEVQKICKPLFESTGIVYFHWAKIFKNGQTQGLVSDDKWYRYFWEKNFGQHSSHFFNPGYHYLKAKQNYSQEAKDMCALFNLDNKFEITQAVDDGYEILGFAGKAGDDQIVNFYFNHLDYLHKFRFYFKDKAHLLIKNTLETKKPIVVEPVIRGKNQNDLLSDDLLKVQKYFISNESVYLTDGEIRCLLPMLRGESMKMISNALNISPRTVEKHLDACKNKLSCRRKADLIHYARINCLEKLV